MIDTAFLQDVAEYVDSRVAKVVLNGTYVITNFEVKQVTDNVLAMKYLIPAADVSLVTTIELKDAGGQRDQLEQRQHPDYGGSPYDPIDYGKGR